MIDDCESIQYCGLVLPQIDIVGVDLEGNLSENGYIYLIQFGFKNPFNPDQNQTLVFDVWKLK